MFGKQRKRGAYMEIMAKGGCVILKIGDNVVALTRDQAVDFSESIYECALDATDQLVALSDGDLLDESLN
jgi:hypothetical protein